MKFFKYCRGYDLLEAKDSENIYNVYKEKLDKIPDADVISVNGENLPTYILCQNRQVLKIRKSRRIMQIPCFTPMSKEDKISKGKRVK